VYVFCTSGTLDEVEILGKEHSEGSTCSNKGEDLEVDSSCDYRDFSSTDKANVDNSFSSQCKGSKSCSFNLGSITFPSSCTGTPFIRVACKSEEIVGIKKSYISVGLVILDIISAYIFWFFLQRHGKFEYLEEDEIYGSALTGRDFTVMIKNLPKDEDPRVLKAKLWAFLEDLLEKHSDRAIRLADDPNAHRIVDINFGMSDYGVMHFYLKRTELSKQEAILNIKINIVSDTKMKEKDRQKKIKALQKKLAKVVKAKDKNEMNYTKFKETCSQQVVKAFVTCQSMEGKLRLLQLYNISRTAKCCNKSKLEDRKFEGKLLDVRHPTDPSLILWENLGVSRKQRCIRISIVALISFLLMIATFIIIVFSKSVEDGLREDYGSGSCPQFTIDQSAALEDQNKPSQERAGLMHCY